MPKPLRMAVALTVATIALAQGLGPATAGPSSRPSAADCRRAAADRTVRPLQSYEPRPGAIRIFAMQFKQQVRNVETYASFREAIECQIRRYVLPHLSTREPNVVAFNEDIGLMTLGTGSRGEAARTLIQHPSSTCAGQGAPCGAALALGALSAGYSREISYYRSRYFPDMGPLSGIFVGATDTFVRGFMTTFSDLARRYGVYILGSSDQAPFRASKDPTDISSLADPDLPPPQFVYVATQPEVYNEVFLWAPRNVRKTGPGPLRNLVASNKKVPLTSLEQLLGFSPGPSTGPAAIANVRPYRVPGSHARLAFATSLPAFRYGKPPAGVDPCSDTSRYYMRCLDRLGANVVVQDEANPGSWAAPGGDSDWQPLEWMRSTWRHVAGSRLRFAYNVTPMLVGNLADLAFDGQSAITQRGLRGRGCHYIGNRRLQAGDPPSYRRYAGPKSQFLLLAPWVTGDGPRQRLRATADRLAPGSGDRLENDYLETALIADLTFPPDPDRRGCISRPPRR
jgi:hypothetical protein